VCVLTRIRVAEFFQNGSWLLTKAQAALERLREWSGESELDLYFYIKEFFIEVLSTRCRRRGFRMLQS